MRSRCTASYTSAKIFRRDQRLEDGAGGRTRTADLRITSALLYLLSYTGKWRSQRDSNPCRSLERAVS